MAYFSWFLSHSDVTYFDLHPFYFDQIILSISPHQFLPNLPVSPFFPNVMYLYLEHPDIIQYCLYSHVCRTIHWIMKSLSREVYLKTSDSSSAKSHWLLISIILRYRWDLMCSSGIHPGLLSPFLCAGITTSDRHPFWILHIFWPLPSYWSHDKNGCDTDIPFKAKTSNMSYFLLNCSGFQLYFNK